MFLRLLITVLSITSPALSCPPASLLWPCTCGSSTIACGDGPYFNSSVLKTTLNRVATRSIEKHFQRLSIAGDQLTEIEAATTGDLIFDEIDLQTPRLTRIHSDAFTGTSANTSQFIIMNAPKLMVNPAPYNIFDLANSFANLSMLAFQVTGINHVPSMAFKSLTNLTLLAIVYAPEGQTSVSFEDNSFANLDNLRQLDLYYNRIDYLPKNVFGFSVSKPKAKPLLRLDLSSNRLNSSGLSWMATVDRPLELFLSYNKVTFLDQTLFQPFLDNYQKLNGTVDMHGNPLTCGDCRLYWLAKGRAKYEGSVLRAFCNGSETETIFTADYSHCDKN